MTARAESDADTLAGGARVGQLIAEKYRLERLLGRGGMGEVYEARHVVVGRRFALKLLHSHLAQGSSAVARFLREARAAGSLENPHIAAVVDFATTSDGVPFLVMEYLEGLSLGRLLAGEGPLPVPRAVSLLLQICRGLEAAHQAGIVHRDLKPDNLFVVEQPDGSELLKILDFGIAKLVDEPSAQLTHSGAVLGTAFYMAPEQARGEKQIDFRVDIYALGVIAFELLSARKPHPGDGYNAILAHILTQPPEPLNSFRAGLPDGLVQLVEAAMAFDPAQRPSSAAAWAEALSAFSGVEVSTSAAHFDLRPKSSANSSAETAADTRTPLAAETSGNTLQSAVGDVRSTATPPGAGRARWPLLLAAGAALAALALLRGREPRPPEPKNGASANAVAVTPALPSASPPSEPLAVRARDVPSVSAPAPSLRAPGAALQRTAPVAPRPLAHAERLAASAEFPSAAAPSSSARQIKFDDKNPY
jgi:eukaryotic-like serine/threonine-protein kinase